MRKKLFNKIVVALITILLIITIGIKAYSVYFFPKISDWNYHQIEKINKNNQSNKNNFSFIVFGDNKNSITTFNQLIKKVNQEKALFSIDVGDLTEDGEKEKFRFFINQIKKAQHPFLTVIGNHGLRENGRANYYNFFGRFYYSFTIGQNYFIILDDANETNIDPWQLNWLKNELQKSQKYQHRFIFMHVPLYDPRDANSTIKIAHCLSDKKFAHQLNNLFDQYNVTMVFASHIHSYFRGYWGKTPYIITGGAGAELAGTNPKHYFYHYIRVNVSSQGVKYQVIKLKSPPFELLDQLSHDIWIYFYSFLTIHFLDLLIIIFLIYFGFYLMFIEDKWIKIIKEKFLR
ncbi:MAG TPA: metallophosphoesterase [Candidatus Portnoybacteria bacterium]|nr:metallophosphoesterase [Candidatus Portnoybacteria bacterium]